MYVARFVSGSDGVCRAFSRAQKTAQGCVVRINIYGIQSFEHADARAVRASGYRFLDAVERHAHRARTLVLQEDLGEIAAGFQRRCKRGFRHFFLNH